MTRASMQFPSLVLPHVAAPGDFPRTYALSAKSRSKWPMINAICGGRGALLTPWNRMDGAFQVHLCLYIQQCKQGKCTDMSVYLNVLYVCTKTQSSTRIQIKQRKRERKRERDTHTDRKTDRKRRRHKRKNIGYSNPY